MTASNTNQQTNQQPVTLMDDDIDIREVTRSLWRRRWLVLCSAVLCAVLGALTSMYLTKYVSGGLFVMPGSTIEDYRKIQAAMRNQLAFDQYLQKTDLGDEAFVPLVRDAVETPKVLAKAMKPIFSATSREVKDYGITAEKNQLVGWNIQLAHRKPTEGHAAELFAEYLRHQVIKTYLGQISDERCVQFGLEHQKLRNQQIQSDFSVKQNHLRVERIKQLIQEYPQIASVDSRQVVSLEHGGERFLSPAAQLVALEVQINNTKLAEEKRKRQGTAAEMKSAYYCAVSELMASDVVGQDALQTLPSLADGLWTNYDKSQDEVEEVINSTAVEQKVWLNQYLKQYRYLTSPKNSEVKEQKPSLPVATLFGLVVGFGGGVFLALLSIWWRDNKSFVTG